MDNERVQTLIDQQQTNLADVDYLDLNSIANVINNIENPTIESENTLENPQESENGIRFRKVEDPAKIAELEAEPKIKTYRAMVEIDGKLYPPMSSKFDGKLCEPSELGVWEEAEESPEKAKQKENGKWYFTLKKDNGKETRDVAYNPYLHSSTTMLNDQFKEAQIDGIDYTIKVVVGVKGDVKYYDHRLTQIEKGTLLDSLSGITTPGFNQETSPVSDVKDKRLLSILQTNSSKIVDENGVLVDYDVNHKGRGSIVPLYRLL